VAARYPERVKSLTLMMTSSGARRLPGPSLKVRGALISRPKDQRVETIVEHYVNLYGLIGSPAYPAGKDDLRERFTRSVRRSYRPAGTARQMVAIAADGDRTSLLGTLRPPTHVIHGLADPLVPVAAARASRARRSTSSTAWATTCRRSSGRASWPASRARPHGPERRASSPPPMAGDDVEQGSVLRRLANDVLRSGGAGRTPGGYRRVVTMQLSPCAHGLRAGRHNPVPCDPLVS
jgi:hypothetical protein